MAYSILVVDVVMRAFNHSFVRNEQSPRVVTREIAMKAENRVQDQSTRLLLVLHGVSSLQIIVFSVLGRKILAGYSCPRRIGVCFQC